MGHHLTSVLWIFWFLLIGLFSWACFANWTNVEERQFACGVVYSEGAITRNLNDEIQAGKFLFRSNCASCHAGDMKTKLTGPPLLTGLEAWSAYPREELYAYVRNSQAVIASGHPRATKIWEEWQPTIMNTFLNLSDEEMESILQYIAVVGGYKDPNKTEL